MLCSCLYRFLFLLIFGVLGGVSSWAATANEDKVRELLAQADQYVQDDEPQKAVAAYTEAAQLDPKNEKVYLGRAKAHAALEQKAEARADYDLAVKANPDSYETWLARAADEEQNDRPAEALRDLDEVVRLKPDEVQAWIWRGCANYDLKHPDKALEDFSQAIQHGEKNGQPDTALVGTAYLNRARMEEIFDRYQEALDDCQKALAAGEDDAKLERAQCLSDLKRRPEALQAFEEILNGYSEVPEEPDDTFYDALVGHATVRAELKDFNLAEDELAAAIKMKPDTSDAYGTLAWTRLLARHYPEAAEAAKKGLALDASQDWIAVNLAHAYLFGGHPELARPIYFKDKDQVQESGKTRAREVLDDFDELREAGLKSPDLDAVEKELRASPPSPAASPKAAQENK